MDIHIKTAVVLSKLLDRQFSFLGFRFGLDPIIGLIPWFGDVVSLMLSLYIIWISMQVGLPANKIAAMVRNTLLDFGIGLIPVVGDLADFVYKANTKNLKILLEHLKNYSYVEGEVISYR